MPPGDGPTGEHRPKELAVTMLVGCIDVGTVEMYKLDVEVDTEGMEVPPYSKNSIVNAAEIRMETLIDVFRTERNLNTKMCHYLHPKEANLHRLRIVSQPGSIFKNVADPD